MAIPVLIIGKSGSGKSASLRNCVGKNFGLINVLRKPLPFRGKIPTIQTDDYSYIMKALQGSQAQSMVIDDAGYLITNHFMRGHSTAGKGNGVFTLYNDLGDQFWKLIQFVISSLPEDKIVYFMMHEDKNDFGDVKPKTIGKLLDEKVCVEGMFTIVLRCVTDGDRHVFVTQSVDGAVSKSPMGMFTDLEIDNDLYLVDQTIRTYYQMNGEEQQ
ncbi:MAG: AAA family ATPase [Peptococcaceae bacterium]